jgi:hypothetical protein
MLPAFARCSSFGADGSFVLPPQATTTAQTAVAHIIRISRRLITATVTV